MNVLLEYGRHSTMMYLTIGHRNADWRQRHPQREYPKGSHICVIYKHSHILHLTAAEISLYMFNTKYWGSFVTERFCFFCPCLGYQNSCGPHDWIPFLQSCCLIAMQITSVKSQTWKIFYFLWPTAAQSRQLTWGWRMHNPQTYPKQFLLQFMILPLS